MNCKIYGDKMQMIHENCKQSMKIKRLESFLNEKDDKILKC